ncbi:MAG: hypothetical protein KGL31_04785 [candidate division NC10 bacterium]|nr:hypothetical protein [candidate division NC10 bacterium]MDE2321218.1 hypothetical protein [candidate division NC10 bacterium]
MAIEEDPGIEGQIACADTVHTNRRMDPVTDTLTADLPDDVGLVLAA